LGAVAEEIDMFDEKMESGAGGATTIEKPKTRAEKVKEWRNKYQAEYKKACEDNCTCTPTRSQMLLIDQWERPPVD
jgi:hypothetical protein